MFKSILKTAVPFLLSFLVLSAGCGDDDDPTGPIDNRFTATENFSFKFDAADLARIGISAISGTVTVVGETGLDSAEVSGVKRVISTTLKDAEDHLSEIQVSVEKTGDGLFVDTDQPSDSAGREYTVDYVISIPDSSIVNCSNVAGVITVRNIEGAVSVVNTAGEIILDGLSGNTNLNVTAGNITGSASLPVDGTMAMSVTSGNITLTIPRSTSASFLATVTTGNITVSNLTLSNEVVTPTTVSGTLGTGQGEITLNVVAGSIVVAGE